MAGNRVATQASLTTPVMIVTDELKQNDSELLNMSLSPSSHSFLSQLSHLMPTRRNRTLSACERAADASEEPGIVTHFCREKGHGFVKPEREDAKSDKIFVHVSDIDGQVVPQVGDSVIFRPIHIPPKLDKLQATHVRITKFNGERHYTWDGHPVPDEL